MKKEISLNLTKLFLFTIFIVMLSFVVSNTFASAKSCPLLQKQTISNNNQQLMSEKIKLIDNYQEKYFKIIKRNNILLQLEDTAVLNKDRKELNALFTEVEKQITNTSYLNKYNNIQKRFSKCNAETTIEINAFAEKNYNAVNNLLNSVYKKAEAKMTIEDKKQLALSESKWEKQVEEYQQVFESMSFGTIGTSIFYEYEINMREFRTLLLMMML